VLAFIGWCCDTRVVHTKVLADLAEQLDARLVPLGFGRHNHLVLLIE
jgi:hypothetical protein